MSNSTLYPEAWAFFTEHARNVENEPNLPGKYRIPTPDQSGQFIYADHPGVLFARFRQEFYRPDANSPSVYGQIQHIVNAFK